MNQQRRKQGGCLTAFLLFMFVANGMSALSYLMGSETIRKVVPNMPAWAPPVLAVMSLANVAFAYGIWNYKKWGVYGIVVSSIVALVINLMSGIPITSSLFGLVGLAILFYLIRPVWEDFE